MGVLKTVVERAAKLVEDAWRVRSKDRIIFVDVSPSIMGIYVRFFIALVTHIRA